MLRAAILALSLLLLSGCWAAETRLFGPGDWVAPEGLDGRFVSENAAGETQGSVVLVRRADGLIDGTVTRTGDNQPQTSPMGFVAIPGGSGRYFLMIPRAPEAPSGKGGEFYLIGRWKDERLDAFWPQCAGTPDMAGMRREKVKLVDETVCTFASKEAVLRAALHAERELEIRRLFEPQLLGRLRRADETPHAEPQD